MSEIHSIHDKVFKSAMCDVRVARDFFEEYLPKKVLSLVNLNTLKLSPNSYVDESLNAFSSDVLYEVQLQDNRVGFFYLLCEHQSSVDPLMAFRLWNYVFRIWSDYLKQTNEKKLPLVFPIVFYHGREPYNAPRRLIELIQAPREIVKDVLFQDFHLVDTHSIEDEVLRERHWVGILGFMMKHVYDRDVYPHLQTVIQMIKRIEQEEGATLYATHLLKYWLISAEIGEKGPKAFVEAIQEALSTSIGGELMTMAEQLRQQGVQQGVQLGIQQGEAQVLISQMRAKFKELPETCIEKISKADSKTLSEWAINFVNAQSLDQVFKQ